MDATRRFLEQMGLPAGDLHSLPSSAKRFPDGAQYRVEIPSTESPAALAAIIEEAGDIQGACCREKMFAYNSAFTGGLDERDYTMVTKQDVNSVVSALTPLLTQHIHASLQQQVRAGETLTPTQCSQKIATDRNAGDEATQVTVTVSESCLAGAYTSTDLQTKVQHALSQQAAQTI